MGVCEGSTVCKGGNDDPEMDIEKEAYENAILEKGIKPKNEENLEQEFEKVLKEIEYPDPNIKVISYYINRNDLMNYPHLIIPY